MNYNGYGKVTPPPAAAAGGGYLKKIDSKRNLVARENPLFLTHIGFERQNIFCFFGVWEY